MSENTKGQERLLQIIQAPYVSEKATFIGELNNQSVFRVARDATKQEIKKAIELLWKDQKIEVENVQTLNVKGKEKRFGRHMGRQNSWKKAIVSIKSGQELNFSDFSKVEAK